MGAQLCLAVLQRKLQKVCRWGNAGGCKLTQSLPTSTLLALFFFRACLNLPEREKKIPCRRRHSHISSMVLYTVWSCSPFSILASGPEGGWMGTAEKAVLVLFPAISRHPWWPLALHRPEIPSGLSPNWPIISSNQSSDTPLRTLIFVHPCLVAQARGGAQ